MSQNTNGHQKENDKKPKKCEPFHILLPPPLLPSIIINAVKDTPDDKTEEKYGHYKHFAFLQVLIVEADRSIFDIAQ